MSRYPTLKPFIVHGHDQVFRDLVVLHLHSTLGMSEPVVLDGVASAGRTIIEKFEEEAGKCNLALVLLTPDDKEKTTAGDEYNTARPNVWLELGYFIAWFGRKTGRTLLIYKEGLDIPTDLSGVGYINATKGFADPDVAKRLEIELNHIVTISPAFPSSGTTSPISGSYNVSGRLELDPR